MQVVAVVYGVLMALLAMVGSFADGGDAWSRLLITLLHPVSAVGLVALVFVRTLGKPVVGLVAALLLVTAAADLCVATLIAGGTVKGDWEVPAILAIVPIVGFLFAVGLLRADVPSR